MESHVDEKIRQLCETRQQAQSKVFQLNEEIKQLCETRRQAEIEVCQVNEEITQLHDKKLRQACIASTGPVSAPAVVPILAPSPAAVPVAASKQDGACLYQHGGGNIEVLNPDGELLQEPEKEEVSENQQACFTPAGAVTATAVVPVAAPLQEGVSFDKRVASEHIMTPDSEDGLLGEPEKTEVSENQQARRTPSGAVIAAPGATPVSGNSRVFPVQEGIDFAQVASKATKDVDINTEAEPIQPDDQNKRLKKLETENVSLKRQLQDAQRTIKRLQMSNDGKYDDSCRSKENKVEKEMDERYEESQSNGQDSWSIGAQSSPQHGESFAKNTGYIKIDYNKSNTEVLKTLTKYICAFLNSAGGKIVLNESKSKNETIIKGRSKLMLSLEQRLRSIMSQSECKECIKWFKDPELPHIVVKEGKRMYTVSSGLKIPFEHSIEDPSHQVIVKILLSVLVGEENLQYNYPDQRYAELSFNNTVPFEEGETIQFKLINKGTATLQQLRKCFEKHLPNYVSAFANYRGGNIYFGIDDSGTVKGQVIGDGQKAEIENMINEIINKKDENKQCVRIWGEPGFTPKDGEQWSIEFLEVLCKSETRKRFVIKVHIRPFKGGMFLKLPLAFKIDETSGEIVKVSFDEWRNICISGKLIVFCSDTHRA